MGRPFWTYTPSAGEQQMLQMGSIGTLMMIPLTFIGWTGAVAARQDTDSLKGLPN